MKQLHAYITQALEEVQACIYYNQALCFGEASATVASTRAHQPAETASDPLKHELQNTRLQASASAYAIRVHQLALEPASDNILTQGQIVTIPCSWIDYSPSLDLDLDLSKLISQLNKYKININVFNKHNAHQSFWDVSWLRRWKNL